MSEIIKEFPIANIARVDIITEEETPKTYTLKDVASEAEVLAHLSEGEEQPLRVKNTIKAQNNTEDIVLGYDIKLVSATLIPQILAIVDGGTWNEVNQEYTAPKVGSAVDRTPFTTKIYTEEKDGDGSTVSYACFEYKNCKGRPVNYSIEDGDFFVPELSMRSRSKLGASPVSLTFLDALPGEVAEETGRTYSYTPSGELKNIIPNEVTFKDDKFIIPAGISVFAFTDDSVEKMAVLVEGSWIVKTIS